MTPQYRPRGSFHRAVLEGLTAQLSAYPRTLAGKSVIFNATELLLVGGGSNAFGGIKFSANQLAIPNKVLTTRKPPCTRCHVWLVWRVANLVAGSRRARRSIISIAISVRKPNLEIIEGARMQENHFTVNFPTLLKVLAEMGPRGRNHFFRRSLSRVSSSNWPR